MKVKSLLLLVSAVACNHTTEPIGFAGMDLNGNHALVAYNGQAIPARLSELPASRAGDPSGCFEEIRAGNLWLSLAGGSGSFAYDYASANTCTGGTLATYRWSGQVTRVDDKLAFHSTATDGLVRSDTARLIAGAIVFDQRPPQLAFASSATP